MGRNVNSKVRLHVSRRTAVLIFSLLLVLVVSSVAFCVLIMGDGKSFSVEQDYILPALDGAVYVENEAELRCAIDDAVGKSVVIALIEDIHLAESALSIPNEANITLTIENKDKNCKIFGAVDISTIVVEDGGVLELYGIIVTHANSSSRGTGVVVNSGGTFIMHSGEISDNTIKDGGGVYNRGTFRIYGGKISGNKATNFGGGVYNVGVFELYGGEITENIADYGGGVYNRGTFNRLGGVLDDNKATSRGFNVY
ncbi:MAG: hypothetical protein FWG55_04755 [Candidatus Bathyarchaeota archaeon]|nr:hypothetical protein [Candidatus Termiticorpusculum sp.]